MIDCDNKIAVLPRMRKGPLATGVENGIPQKRSNPKLVNTSQGHPHFVSHTVPPERENPVHQPRAMSPSLRYT